jgi:L-lactate dehydrogenase complex protein LldG
MALSSRELILSKAKQNNPDQSALPDITFLEKNSKGSIDKFNTILLGIGGHLYHVQSYHEILSVIKREHPEGGRIYSPVPEVNNLLAQPESQITTGHDLEDVEVAIIKAHFAVAENGAVWVTDDLMEHRALPFIAQHLAVIISEADLLPTMHEAYLRMANIKYNYGAFIAGPSKTADIEQSLVLGAHGPKSLMVFLF